MPSTRQQSMSGNASAQENAQELFFVFYDGKEVFAVPPSMVVEVLLKTEATPVPFTPEWIDGVISVRGGIVPVLDLTRYFGLATASSSRQQRSRLILMGIDKHFFAVWSDRILGIESIDQNQLEQPLNSLPDPLLRNAVAQFRLDETLVFSIDLRKLVNESREQMRAVSGQWAKA